METGMIKKNIQLPKGGTLELAVTPKFLDVVRSHFNVSATDAVGDDYIRMYIWGAFKNAIDKAEKENRDVYSSA
jgi:hypothetical protein